MSSIVLINANTCINPMPVYPLGLSYVAAACKQAGHVVTLLDISLHTDTLVSRMASTNPDIVGISLRNIDDNQIDNTKLFTDDLYALCKKVRKATAAPIVLGGSGYSLFPQQLLEQTGADFGICGEGENAMVMLIDALNSSGQFHTIPQLFYRENNSIIVSKASSVSSTQPLLPWRPDDIFSFYIATAKTVNIQTQRGCPLVCCYCTYPLLEGHTSRFFNPERVAEDFIECQNHGAPYVFIVDSVFNTSNDHVASVCEKLIEHKVSIPWGCFLRPKGLTADLLKLMKLAGLKHIEYGSDSFCDPVLGAYGKGFSFDDIYFSSELARSERIHYAHFLIAGGPSETEETLRETFSHALYLKHTVFFPFIGMRMYPGTPLVRQAVREEYLHMNDNLLTPRFYISPHVAKNRIVELFSEFAARAPNWIYGEFLPEQKWVINKLRAKGVPGPLWEFLVR